MSRFTCLALLVYVLLSACLFVPAATAQAPVLQVSGPQPAAACNSSFPEACVTFLDGSYTPSNQLTFQVTSSDGGAISFTASAMLVEPSGVTLPITFSVTPVPQTTPASVTVQIQVNKGADGYPTGTYLGYLTLTSPSASNSPLNFPIQLTVFPSPAAFLVSSPDFSKGTELDFGTVAAAKMNLSVQVTDTSSPVPSFSVTTSTTDGNHWLSAQGTNNGASCSTPPCQLSISVNPTGLPASKYYAGFVTLAPNDGTGGAVVTVTMTAAVNYTLTVSDVGQGLVTSSDGGINCVNGSGACSTSYASGTMVTLNATPATGWSFQGWSGACSGSGSRCQVTMNSNLASTATFAQAQPANYTLMVSDVGQGTITSTDGSINCISGSGACSASYSSGTNVTLNATAATGWSFQGWSGACTGIESVCQVTMNSNLSPNATFKQAANYTLTVSEAGQGTVTSTDGSISCISGSGACSASYSSGTNVTLNATAATGWSFQGWSGACTGIGSVCQVTMNSNLSPNATFKQAANYTLTVSEAGQGTVTSTDGSISCISGSGACSASYPSGTVVPLNATAASGWSFQGWSGACTGIGSVCQVTMNSNLSPNATFKQNVINPTQGPLLFVTMPPCRVVDTRDNTKPEGFGPPSFSVGTTRSFTIPSGPCNGIPANAQAYALNVTVVPNGPLEYITVWPTGQSQPNASTLNSFDGEVKANAAIVAAGTGAAISVYATNDTDVVLDINGYFVPNTEANALAFYPLAPCRVVDTRPGAASTIATGRLAASSITTLPILSSNCNVPATAQAYSLNFTLVPPETPVAYLTVWPTGEAQPFVSTLNDPTGTVEANAGIVPAGSGGSIDVYVTDATDLVVDINGYFAPAAEGGLSLYTLAPCRVLDTRNPVGTPPFQGAINVDVIRSGCIATNAAQAYVFNATVVPGGPLALLNIVAGRKRATIGIDAERVHGPGDQQHGDRAHEKYGDQRVHQQQHVFDPGPVRLLRAVTPRTAPLSQPRRRDAQGDPITCLESTSRLASPLIGAMNSALMSFANTRCVFRQFHGCLVLP